MSDEQKQDPYDVFMARLEPNLPAIENEPGMFIMYSVAISMKRIADALNSPNEYGEVGSAALAGSIKRGLRE